MKVFSSGDEHYLLIRLKMSQFKDVAETAQVMMQLDPLKLQQIAQSKNAEILGIDESVLGPYDRIFMEFNNTTRHKYGGG